MRMPRLNPGPRKRTGGKLTRTVQIAGAVAVLLILVIGGASVFALLNNVSRHLDRPLAQALAKMLHREVRVGSVDVLSPGRIHFRGLAVSAGRTFQSGDLMRAPDVVVQYNLWDMLRGRVDPIGSISSIVIRSPYLLITRDRNNHFNLQDLLKLPKKPPKPSKFRGIVRVVDGTVRFEDANVRDLPAPQVNTLAGLDATLDAGAPPLMVVTAAGHGDGRRVGNFTGVGSINPGTSGFSFRVNAPSSDLPYWTRYFAHISNLSVLSGSGIASVDVWKLRQGNPVGAVIGVSVAGASGTSPLTTAPLTNVGGSLRIQTGRPLSVGMDVAGYAGSIPVHAWGSIFTGKNGRVAINATASQVTLPALRQVTRSVPNLAWLTPLAPATVQAQVYGPPGALTMLADVQVPRAKLYTSVVDNVDARVRYENRVVYLPSITGTSAGRAVSANGVVDLNTKAIRFIASVPDVTAASLGLKRLPITGDIASRIVVTGTTTAPQVGAMVTVTNGRFRNVPFRQLAARLNVRGRTVHVARAVATLPGATLLASGDVNLDGPLRLNVHASGLQLGRFLPSAGYRNITGTGFFDGTVTGTWQAPQVSGDARVLNAVVFGRPLDYVMGHIGWSPRQVRLDRVLVARYPAQASLHGTANFLPNGQIGLHMRARLHNGRLEDLLAEAGVRPVAQGNVSTAKDIVIGGTVKSPDIRGTVLLTQVSVNGYQLNRAESDIHYTRGLIEATHIRAVSNVETTAGTTVATIPVLQLIGNKLKTPKPFSIQNVHLDRFPGLGEPYVKLAGTLDVTNGTIAGTVKDPAVSATITLPTLTVNGIAFHLSPMNVSYRKDVASVTGLTLARNGAVQVNAARLFWNTATKKGTADVRIASLPLAEVIRILEQSDWYNSPEGDRLRLALDRIDRYHIHPETATFSLAGETGPAPGSEATTPAATTATAAATVGTTTGTATGTAAGTPAATAPPLPPTVATGTAHITGSLQDISVEGSATLAGLTVEDQRLDRVTVTGALHHFRDENGALHGAISIPPGGFHAESGEMTVNGELNGTIGGRYTGVLDAANVPVVFAKLVRPVWFSGPGRAPEGQLSVVRVETNGNTLWSAPELTASITGRDIRFGPETIPIRIATNAISVTNDPDRSGPTIRSTIRGDINVLARDHAIRLRGVVPWSWKDKIVPVDRDIDLSATLEEQNLDILQVLYGGPGAGAIETASGTVAGQVSLTGTRVEPKLNGYFRVNDGTVKMRALSSALQNINVDLAFDPKQHVVVVNRLSAKSSKGGTLSVEPNGTIDLAGLRRGLAGITPHLALAFNNFRVEEDPAHSFYGERIRGTLNTPPTAPIRITKGAASPLVAGDVVLSDVDVQPPNRGPAAISNAAQPAFNPSFDLRLVVGKNVMVRNPLFQVKMDDRGPEADRSLRVTNTLWEPRIEGRLTSHEGAIVYPTARFRLTNAVIRVHYPTVQNVEGAGNQADLIQLAEGSSPVSITADAQARLVATVNNRQEPVTVYMHIEGPNAYTPVATGEEAFNTLAPYRISLRSTPSLPQRQLIALISREQALQMLASGAATPEDILRQETMNILQASVLPQALSGFETRLGQALGLESLSLEYLTLDRTVTVSASKRLGNRILLTYSRPLGAAAASNAYTVSLSYEISPRLRLTLQQQKGPFLYGAQSTVLTPGETLVTDTQILLEGSHPF